MRHALGVNGRLYTSLGHPRLSWPGMPLFMSGLSP